MTIQVEDPIDSGHKRLHELGYKRATSRKFSSTDFLEFSDYRFLLLPLMDWNLQGFVEDFEPSSADQMRMPPQNPSPMSDTSSILAVLKCLSSIIWLLDLHKFLSETFNHTTHLPLKAIRVIAGDSILEAFNNYMSFKVIEKYVELSKDRSIRESRKAINDDLNVADISKPLSPNRPPSLKPSKSTFYAPPSPLELPDEYEDFHRRILALPQLQSSAAMTSVAAIQHQIVGEQRDDTHSNVESDSGGARSVKANGRAGSGGENAGCGRKRPPAPPRTCPYHG
nr:hypothetical protein Iba_chr12dCG6300 [Ipomoea batatas]